MSRPFRERARAPRRAAALAAVAAALLLVAGCTGAPQPRPVTDEEAQRLAVARFNAYDERWMDLELTVPAEGRTLAITARADLQSHRAVAGVVATSDDDGVPPEYALLQWTLAGKALQPTPAPADPSQPPSEAWTTAGMTAGDPLDTALLLAMNLASDRPENPVLLAQHGARWIGTTTIDGAAVDVFTGPGADDEPSDVLRYAVDARGILHRVEADLPGGGTVVIALTPSADDSPIPLTTDLEALGAPAG